MDVSFRHEIDKARKHGDLYFAALLPEEVINLAFGQARWLWRSWIYSPVVTIWVFLSQCLSQDHSCRDAVASLINWRLAKGLPACSAETGAYCTARARIPEEVCRQLALWTGARADNDAPDDWRWHGHRVRCVDGSTITMPDTPANQAAYPQVSTQAPGCGFPIARIVVVFSLAVGTVLDAAIGNYEGKQTGENSLFRSLHGVLEKDDIVLEDRYFSGWFDIALLLQAGVHVVVRKHAGRSTDFRRGYRLGKDDQIVQWKKPAQPDWMTEEQYAALPNWLTLRETRVRVKQKGFRTKVVIVITSLLDAESYPADEIATLYRRRWDAELNLRSLKTVMQMDHLRCLAPDRVRNEFYMHLVAYNLIRRLMAIAAYERKEAPWTISFKGTMQTLDRLLPLLPTTIDTDEWVDAIIRAVATHTVGNRPDRIEPRVKKRRPKNYPRMTKPRHEYKTAGA